MKRLLLFILLLLGTVPVVLASSPIAGTVSLDSVQVRPGDKFSVGVHLNGSATNLSGLSIPIHFNSADLTIDSVSFTGSVAPGGVEKQSVVNNGLHKVKIIFYPNLNVNPLQSIPSTGGLLANIFFTASPTALPGAIALDTVYDRDSIITSDSSVVYLETETLNAADPQATTSLYPDYVAGLVSIQVPTGTGDDDHAILPLSFNLAQNYPNPFNPTTQISFTIPKRSTVQLEVFNVLGQRVATLLNEVLPAGEHTVTFDASHQPSGIYFYRLTHNEGSQTKKMVFLK